MGQKKVAIVENGLNKSQCTMYGLSAKKVAMVERWLLVEAWLSSIKKIFLQSSHVSGVEASYNTPGKKTNVGAPPLKRIMILAFFKKVNI